MPTPEVTGSAASHSEEIKKIAREYETQLSTFFVTAEEVATDFLEWLSKTHCIVPKEQIYMRHGVALALMEQDPSHKEFYRGQSSVLESIFGTALFNEEKE